MHERSRAKRWLQLANRELQYLAYNWQRTEAVGWPIVYQIELTNHCPMTCEMCPRTDSMSRPLGFMEQGLFRSIVDQIQRSTSHVFLHHFGDSLVYPELGSCIEYATARGIRCGLSANPVLLNESRIKALVDNGLHELILSLDGVSSETNKLVRGPAAANVDKAERRIKELIQYRAQSGKETPYITLQIVRQKQNNHEIEAWLQKWQGTPGLERVKVKSFIAWNGQDENINALRLDPATGTDVVCSRPWTSLTILWDGRVVPCCFDQDGLLSLGDLNHQSLGEIWQGQKAKDLRRSHRDQDFCSAKLCEKCEDKDGFDTQKWYYPLNRFFQDANSTGDEWGTQASKLQRLSRRLHDFLK